MRQLWIQQYQVVDGAVRWRRSHDLPPGKTRLTTPHDTEARCGVKRETVWHGYKAHLTETCEPDAPHLITQVLTTVGSVSDIDTTAVIHARLDERRLLPDTHIVDAGYVDVHLITTSERDHGVELLGPVASSTVWQAGAGGFALEDFTIDWEKHQATCPQDRIATSWRPDRSQAGVPVVRVTFRSSDCKPCPVRDQCTTSAVGRRLTLRPELEHRTLQKARADQRTAEWRQRYAARQGVEGTISQAVRSFGLRRARYRGLAKTRLQHQLAAAAINLARLSAWVIDHPLAATRHPPLMQLRLAA
ncbi:transposase [Kitasatospora aburaviensis]